jgi:hypothetical protein
MEINRALTGDNHMVEPSSEPMPQDLREAFREAAGLYRIVFTQWSIKHGRNCAKSR